MKSCRRDTVGNGTAVNHGNRTILPGSTPWPYYPEIVMTGKQTFCQDIGMDMGFGRFTPLCYNYAQMATYIENESRDPFGLETVSYKGFYDITLGTCSGYDTVVCNNITNVIEEVDGEGFENATSPANRLLHSLSSLFSIIVFAGST